VADASTFVCGRSLGRLVVNEMRWDIFFLLVNSSPISLINVGLAQAVGGWTITYTITTKTTK
jgi:hypothetical protein